MKHGGPHAYHALGCRCSTCVKWAKKRRAKYTAQIKQRIKENDPTLNHKSFSVYSAGCRCETCIETKNKHIKQSRESLKRRLETDPNLVKHGSKPTYKAGCRCNKCVDAHKTKEVPARRRRSNAKQQGTLQAAENNGKEWTSQELEIVTRYSTLEAAHILGRTYWSVHAARKKINKKDPKVMYLLNDGRPETRGAVQRPTSGSDLMQSA